MPNINSIPPEILVEILTNLDYITLHATIRLVCRSVNEIIESAKYRKLCEKLFRCKLDNLPITIEPGKDEVIKYCHELHPCIPLLMAKYHVSEPLQFWPQPEPPMRVTEVDDVGFYNLKDGKKKFIPLSSTNIGNELAIAPRVPVVVPSNGKNAVFPLTSPFIVHNRDTIDRSLTVQKFIDNILRMLRKPGVMHIDVDEGPGYIELLILNDLLFGRYEGREKKYRVMKKDIFARFNFKYSRIYKPPVITILSGWDGFEEGDASIVVKAL